MKKIPIPATVRALLFDCDGTLADTMPVHWQAWHNTFAQFGKKCPQEFLDQFTGVPAEKIIKAYNSTYSENVDVPSFLIEKQKRANKALFEVQPIQPVVDIVHAYRGKMPMAVVSGGSRPNVLRTLETIGLKGFFDEVITADDPFPPKPSPVLFLETAKLLSVDPQFCLVFEDGDLGLQGAKEAGMMVVDVREYL